MAVLVSLSAVLIQVRPAVLHSMHSPYTSDPERHRTITSAPVGLFSRHHAGLQERYEKFTELARSVAASCDRKILVLVSGALSPTMLYRPGADVKAAWTTVGPFEAFEVSRGDQHFLYLSPSLIWPQDPVAFVLGDESLRDYRIFQSPYEVSSYNKTSVPPDRVAHLPSAESTNNC